jgi:hypothetical protein
VVIKLAIFKFGKGQKTQNIAEAVQMCVDECIAHALGSDATMCTPVKANTFRKERLYFQGVDDVMGAHEALLRAVFDLYKGAAPKRLNLEGVLQLCAHASMFRCNLTRTEAKWCFVVSRTLVVDEVMSRDAHTGLNWVDFLECVSRMADVQSPPTTEELERSLGVKSLWEVFGPNKCEKKGRMHRRPSTGLVAKKTRLLEDKVEQVLEQLLIPSLCVYYGIPVEVSARSPHRQMPPHHHMPSPTITLDSLVCWRQDDMHEQLLTKVLTKKHEEAVDGLNKKIYGSRSSTGAHKEEAKDKDEDEEAVL